jgi:hypothetical protein
MLLVRFAECGADLHRNGGPPQTARCRTRISPVFRNRPIDAPYPPTLGRPFPFSDQHSQARKRSQELDELARNHKYGARR